MIALSKFLKENPQHDPFDLPLFPPVLISKLWRTHVLFTTTYPKFCKMLGFNYISYSMNNFNLWETKFSMEYLKTKYERTKSIMKELFGDIDEKIWVNNFNDIIADYMFSFNLSIATLKNKF